MSNQLSRAARMRLAGARAWRNRVAVVAVWGATATETAAVAVAMGAPAGCEVVGDGVKWATWQRQGT